MAPSSRIPTLLQPHTRLPRDHSIFLLTSTLGASANWLITRFLCEALGRDPASRPGEDGEEGNEDVAVVLVSWMRDWDFWRSEARKGGGLDLERLRRDKKLAFVDGLTKMSLVDMSTEKTQPAQTPVGRPVGPSQTLGAPPGRTPQTVLPVRGPPGRINPRAPAPAPAATPVSTTAAATTAQTGNQNQDQYFITSPELKDVQRTIEEAIRRVQSTAPQRKCLLILDTPSFLLASNPKITVALLAATILQLHMLTSHILVHIPADDALISPSTPPQPLEVDGHNFLVKMAHMSSRILSCRVLDTGFAKDVSGVLRITENQIGLNLQLQPDNDANAEEKHGRELLYLVKGDGSVKMFERGAGGDI